MGGQPFSTKVPTGTYELRYAVGQEWTNEQEYFGPKTAFYKADRLLTFSIEGDRVLGSEVELILQRGGNGHSEPAQQSLTGPDREFADGSVG